LGHVGPMGQRPSRSTLLVKVCKKCDVFTVFTVQIRETHLILTKPVDLMNKILHDIHWRDLT
jgi:hypothetical protein